MSDPLLCLALAIFLNLRREASSEALPHALVLFCCQPRFHASVTTWLLSTLFFSILCAVTWSDCQFGALLFVCLCQAFSPEPGWVTKSPGWQCSSFALRMLSCSPEIFLILDLQLPAPTHMLSSLPNPFLAQFTSFICLFIVVCWVLWWHTGLSSESGATLSCVMLACRLLHESSRAPRLQ